MNKKKKYFFIIIPVVLCIAGFYNGLIVKNYVITSEKLLGDTHIKIVLITDLHSHIYGDNQSKIIKKIQDQKPDIIALSGDIVDDVEPYEGAEIFLEKVKDIAPTYYVTGNHEFWSGEIDKIKSDIAGIGINILENEKQVIDINGNKVHIYGIDDPEIMNFTKDLKYESWEDILHSFWETADDNQYNILLSHRPEKAEDYKQYAYDLILSGHAHGGQVRIPFLLNGLLSPNQGFFPQYAGGLYKYNNTNHVVSRGVSFNPRLPRIFNPPEIVVIEIISKKLFI